MQDEMHALKIANILTTTSLPARTTTPETAHAPSHRSPLTCVPQPRTAALAISSALLLTVATSGWFMLRSVSAGTGGLHIRLNWTAIVALGAPFVALAFLLAWLFVWVALREDSRDTTQPKSAGSERTARLAS